MIIFFKNHDRFYYQNTSRVINFLEDERLPKGVIRKTIIYVNFYPWHFPNLFAKPILEGGRIYRLYQPAPKQFLKVYILTIHHTEI